MAKREFLMLSHVYNPEKQNIAGWFLSKKLDGQRAFWDGGISRGMELKDIPFANTTKDDRYVNFIPIATGLWTRNAKAIQAPNWWLDNLPKDVPLDGELYAGLNNFQLTSSIVRKIDQSDDQWDKIKYKVFDSPSFKQIFSNGIIDTSFYKKDLSGSFKWAVNKGSSLTEKEFEIILVQLRKLKIENDFVHLHEQIRLPFNSNDANKVVEQYLDECAETGEEGLMLRRPSSIWTPERSHNLLKVKKYLDSEATVVGYTWGRETNKGSKLLGKMGAMIVAWQGKRFELSGFSDSEREMVHQGSKNDASDIGKLFPGKMVQVGIVNSQFPIGSTVCFKYRELTDIGIPKEAAYFRKD